MPYQSPWNEDDQTLQMPYNPNWEQNIQTTQGQQPQYQQQQAGQQGQQTQPVPVPQYQATPDLQGQQRQQGPVQAPNEWTQQSLQDYFTARGATPAPTSIDYWLGKRAELDARGQQIGDPNYANMRLGQAEEFGGNYGGGGGGMGAYVPGQGVAGMGSALGGQWGGRANNLYEMLMQRAGQSLNIDRNDPVIRNQADAYDAMQQRASRNYLGDIAERAGPNANISAERRSAAEKVGQAGSAFQAQLMGRELDARRNEIAQALSGMGGLLSDQQRMALQEELSQLGLAQQAYQFDQQQQYAYSPFGGGY